MSREPDFVIAGLSIWVDGPQTYADGQVDRQWLEIRAVAEATGSRIEIAGPFLRRTDFRHFQKSLMSIHRDLSGAAFLGSMEPALELSVAGDGMGHVNVTLEITPNYTNQAHRLSWTVDQTELVEPLKQLYALVVVATRAVRRVAWTSRVE